MHLRQFIRVCERQEGYLQACRHTAKISDAGFLCFLTETGKSPASIANAHMTPIIFHDGYHIFISESELLQTVNSK